MRNDSQRIATRTMADSSSSQMAGMPGHDPAERIHANSSRTVIGEGVPDARIPDELDRTARLAQGREQFLSLPDRAAVVLLTVHDQGGRASVRSMKDR